MIKPHQKENSTLRILIASSIYADTIEQLRTQHDVKCAFNAKEDALQHLIHDREVLIFRSGVNISATVMACAPDLKLLIRAGSGTDNLDLAYVREHNIELIRVPEPGAKAVAEMSFAFMLALARNLLEADRLTRQGRWAKQQFSNGVALGGKTLGIVGAGNIGARVGEMGVAWGMQVLGCVEHPSPQVAAKLSAKGIRLTSFDEIVTKADFLSLHVPLKDTTRNLVDDDVLARMKPGAYLINLARGGVVDEQALYDALVEGRLRGAALDVHREEGDGKVSILAELPNVILTPHIGAGTIDSQREIGERVLEIMEEWGTQQSPREETREETREESRELVLA